MRKGLFILLFFQCIAIVCLAQGKYKVRLIEYYAVQDDANCNVQSITFGLLANGQGADAMDGDALIFNNIPNQVTIDSYETRSAIGQCIDVITTCSSYTVEPINLEDCGGLSQFFSACYTAPFIFTMEPILTPIAGPPSSGTFCKTDPINLSAKPGFGSYSWQYNLESAADDDWQPFATTGSPNISPSLVSLFGANADNYISDKIIFRYSIGNCDPSTDYGSGVTPSYKFGSDLFATSLSAQAPLCNGGSDGIVNFSLNRGLVAGENYSPEMHAAPNIGSALIAGPLNNSTMFMNVPAGTYYILVGSPYNCGAGTWVPVTIPSGPRNAITATSAVTSSYNGYQISCPSPAAPNGQITVTAGGGNGTYTFSLDGGTTQASNVFSTVGPGNHTVTVKDGCATPATIVTNQVSLSAPTPIVVSSVTPFLCNTGSSGQITITASGGAGSTQYSIDGTTYQASNVFSGLGQGTYNIFIKDINSCTVIGGSAVVPGAINAGNFSVTQPACAGNNGTITLSGASGGTGALSWSINGTTFQPIATAYNAPAGTYTVTVKDANGCAVVNGTQATITDPTPISISNGIVQPSCFGNSNGSITVTASNGVSPYQYSKDGGATYQGSNVFNTGIAAGTYPIVVKGANGCVSGVSTAIVSQPLPVNGNIPAPAPFACYNTANTATLDLTASGGTGPYTFLWNTGATSEDISANLNTSLSVTYSVAITDSKSCTSNKNITVSQPSQLSSTISGTNVTCAGGSNGTVNLTPSGGTTSYTFLWNNGATTEDLSSRTAGTYSVTITDANSCTITNSIVISEPSAITLTQGTTTNVLCNGGSTGTVNLVAAGGTGSLEYSKDGTTWQSSSLITGLSANTYTLYVRDQSLCSKQITTTITQPPVLTVSYNNVVDASCGTANGSAQSSATGGTGGYSFVWRNVSNQIVSTSSSLTNVSGGVYRVTVTDQNNCTDFKDVAISSPNGPVVTVNSVTGTSCFDSNDGKANITVTGGQSPYTITWNNGETGVTAVALHPGTGVNFVTVKDNTGCEVAYGVDVPSPTQLGIAFTPTQPVCHGDSNGSIDITPVGGTSPYTYSWNTGATTSLLSGISEGAYFVTVKDAKNCSNNLGITLVGKLPIAIQSTVIQPGCGGGSNGSIAIAATGSNGSFTYLWNTGASGTLLSNLSADTYTVTATDGLGCSSQQSFILTAPAPFAIDLGPDRKICTSGSLKISSPVTGVSYSWTSSGGFSSGAKEVTLTQAGTYKLQVTSSNGCIGEDTFELTTATDLLNADFLMVTEAYVGDTVIVIDISWPLPESISWHLPVESTVVAQNTEFAEIIFHAEGSYIVSLDAFLASCQDTYSQNITILPGARPSKSGRIASERLIENVKLYPNPNVGEFSVDVDLSSDAAVEITIVNINGNKVEAHYSSSGRDFYHWPVSLPPLQQGLYVVLVKAGSESRSIQFVKL